MSLEEDEIIFIRNILKQRHYVPIEKISYGSYGQIFKIKNQTGRNYAMKIISKQKMHKQHKLHEAVVEGIILQKIQHKGIIGFLETIQTPEYIAYILQYCPYGDLTNIIKKVNSNLSLQQNKKYIYQYYLAQIVQVLFYLHTKGIIHRDLKFQNIVVGEDFNIRFIDFGTAKPIDPSKVYSEIQQGFINKLRAQSQKAMKQQLEEVDDISRKSFVGSAQYLSPESISMNHSLATDIWAFGIVMYRMFHGKLPFQGSSTYQIFKQIKQYKLQISNQLDKEIQDLIKQCLCLDPTQRPTAIQLCKHPYFKLQVHEVFTMKSPIPPQIFQQKIPLPSFEDKNKTQLLLDVLLQKKMFLGNHKPRLLKMHNRAGVLYMSYWYTGGSEPKNQFQISLGDHAVSKNSKSKQFCVKNRDVEYSFRTIKEKGCFQLVEQINQIITSHFHE